MATRKQHKRVRCGHCRQLMEPDIKNGFLAEDKHWYHFPCIAQWRVFIPAELGIGNAYDWQKAVWEDVAHVDSRTALRAANGSGKTAMIAAAIALANAMLNVESTGVVTSGVMRQVREQFWPAMRRLIAPLMTKWQIEMTASKVVIGSTRSEINGFTASDTFKFEGFHRTGPKNNLLVVVDEAKSIKDDIFDAVERMQPSRLLMQSSPGPAVGAFWRAWGPEKAFWKKHVVQAKDCPHLINLKVKLDDGSYIPWIDSVIQKYGPNAPLTKSMVFADWMSDEGEMLICPLHWYDRCLERAPEKVKGEYALGIDVAAGGDENVIALRDGNEVRILDKWRDRDTFQAAVKISALIKRTGVSPEHCYLDVGGMGVTFADLLANMGLHVQRVNFGGRAVEPEHYINRGSEMWSLAGRRIEESAVRLPDDDELRSQFTTRRYKLTKGDKVQLESKEDMKRRGLKSPDRADAVVLAMIGAADMGSLSTTTPYGETALDKLTREFERRQELENEVIGGIDCGG